MMRPMLLYESRESTGELSLEKLFEGPDSIQGINDLNTMRLLFETMCVRDLCEYAQSIGGNVLHYRIRVSKDPF